MVFLQLNFGAVALVEKSFCGNCMECVRNCPAKAITGELWNVTTERSELIDVEKCRKTAIALSKKNMNKEIAICGKCFAVCPYTLKNMNKI